MKKKVCGMLGVVCMMVLGVFFLSGCGAGQKKQESAAEMLASVGLKTFTEVIGEEVPYVEEEVKGEGQALYYYPAEEKLEELQKQYEEYLTQEAEAYAGVTWNKDGVSVTVTFAFDQEKKAGAVRVLVNRAKQ